MSIITKIFVVLATVLAILIVPLMIAYVNNTEHFKQQWLETRGQLAAAQSAARISEAQLAQAQARFAEDIKDAEQEKAGLIDNINGLMSQIQAKDVAITDLRDQLVGVQADLKQAIDSSKQAHDIIATLEEEVKRRREQAVVAEKRLVELTDQNQELETSLQLAVENVRLLKEQLADSETLIDEMQEKIARGGQQQTAGDVVGPGPVLPPGDIRGIITNVQRVGEADVFVAVNVGQNDQVAPGMNFIIHDGDQYVGSLTITKVDLNQSAGRVTLKRGTVSENQQVLATAE